MNEEVEYHEEDKIRALLVGRSIVRTDKKDGALVLDDGTRLIIEPNSGCGGCDAGNYWINEIVEIPVNAIMNVEFDDECVDGITPDDAYGYEDGRIFRVFVLAEDQRIKLLEVEGDTGNGYYGQGYWIKVVKP